MNRVHLLPVSESDRERFWSYVDKSAGTEACWPWIGYKRRRYGTLRLSKPRRSARANRLAYALSYNSDPQELLVCHRCDAPLCCNPKHLFLGTNLDNMNDMIRKGRSRKGDHKGEKNPRAKLSSESVKQIKDLILEGRSNTEIASIYEVKHATISSIRTGKTWK